MCDARKKVARKTRAQIADLSAPFALAFDLLTQRGVELERDTSLRFVVPPSFTMISTKGRAPLAGGAASVTLQAIERAVREPLVVKPDADNAVAVVHEREFSTLRLRLFGTGAFTLTGVRSIVEAAAFLREAFAALRDVYAVADAPDDQLPVPLRVTLANFIVHTNIGDLDVAGLHAALLRRRRETGIEPQPFKAGANLRAQLRGRKITVVAAKTGTVTAHVSAAEVSSPEAHLDALKATFAAAVDATFAVLRIAHEEPDAIIALKQRALPKRTQAQSNRAFQVVHGYESDAFFLAGVVAEDGGGGSSA